MTELTKRVAALSAEKRHLLEALRKEKRGERAIRESAAEAPRAAPAAETLTVAPFGLLSEEDRARIPAGVEDAFPLTLVQLGMIHHMGLTAGDDTPAYHNVNSFHIRGPFVGELFQAAVDAVVKRHPQLRISFDLTRYSEPLQLVHEKAELRVVVEDLRHLDEGEQKRRLAAFISEENRNFVDLSRPPLIRLRVHRWTDDRFNLTLTEPHAISDGWSTAANLGEIFQGYLARVSGEATAATELPPPSAAFRDFVALERQALASEEHRRFWSGKLEGRELIPLYRLPRRSESGSRDRKPSVWFAPEVVDGLQRLSRNAGMPLKSILLAGHLKVMSLYSGGGEVVTGLTTHGRPEVLDGEQVRGLFLNTVPFFFRFGAESWADLSRRVFRNEAEVWPYRRYPLAAMQRLCGRRTLFESAFSFLHFHSLTQLLTAGGAERIEEGSSDLSVTDFPLMATFTLRSVSNALRLTLEHDHRELGAGQILDIAACYERVLTAMATAPEAAHDAVPLLPAEQRQLVLQEWNRPDIRFSGEPSLHRLFERQAARRPEAVAVVCAEARITYGELNERANRLARYLRARGVGPECRVGLYLERGPEIVVGLLGILKAGGAYVPMDPAYPRDRVAFVLADAGLRLLVTQESLRENLPEGCGARVLCLDSDWDEISRESPEDPDMEVDPDAAAYVIYTSGSTGRPKGVVIPHRNAIRLFQATDAWFQFGESDVWTLFHSHAFDFSVWEIWGPLLHGGQLVVVPYAVSRSPRELQELLRREGVTVLNQTPSAFQQLVGLEEPERLEALRTVIFGGEALNLAALKPWFERYGDGLPRLVNMYGITETTVHVTYRPLTTADLAPEAVSSPIGLAMPDLQLYVLDSFFQPLPLGVAGEIHVGGDGLARGYLGQPELTAERFVPDPLRGRAGARLYRSGDLGRFLPGGEVEYLGRSDRQVKVRGFRIELGEIEAALASHPAVSQAAVVLREDGGQSRLVGYVAARPDDVATLSAAELRALLKTRLPEYMLPAALVVLESLPLTANGKLDVRALPAPDGEPAGEDLAAAPRTVTEELLAGMWAEVLQREQVGIRDNFFELGGHSLLATQLFSRVVKTFQVGLPLQALFDEPTVAGLARRIDVALAAGERPEAPPVVRVARDGDLPLSFSQQRLWFLDQLEPGGSTYNVPAAVRLQGALDPEALGCAFTALAARHEVLRTVYRSAEGKPRQEILASAPAAMPLVDLAGLPEAVREVESRRLSAAEARLPFDLAAGPVLRTALLRLGGDDHLLLATLHHIASDGWSIGVVNREVAALYNAFVQGLPSPLPELPVQYADFASWQRRWLAGPVLAQELAYWRERLAGAPPVLPLPTDRPRPPVPGVRAARRRFDLAPELSASLASLGRREGATLFMVLLAAFEGLLRELTGSVDVSVGTPVAGRRHLETEGLIGFFVNTLVLRGDLSGNPSFRELLGRTRAVALEAQLHQDLPFEKLVEEVDPERDLSRNPLFQVMFGLQNAPRESLTMTGLRASTAGPQTGMAAFDLTLLATERQGRIEAGLGYKEELFDPSTVVRIEDAFVALLRQVATRPDLRLDDLLLLSEAERHALLCEWNDTGMGGTGGETLSSLFEAQAARTPDAVALVAGTEEVTFRDLDRRAGRLARHLVARGVRPETIVGLFLARTADLIVAIVAVHKAGGAYLPLDLAHPAERLALLIEDARPLVLITEGAQRHRLPQAPGGIVCVDADREAIARESPEPPRAAVPDNLAYVIYTSGSTGVPKGVAIAHRSAVSLLHWAREVFPPADLAGLLASTSINFDLSVFEIFLPLTWGGTLILAENALHLPDLPAREAVRLINTVPSAIVELARADAIPAGVRTVNLAGEPLSEFVVERLFALPTVERVLNLYGPSEDTTYSTYAEIRREDGGAPTIGRALGGKRAYLLDRALRPVPLGCVGELYLAGEGLARGYLGRPAATAGSFLPNPLGLEPGARMYRTGDLARHAPGGDLRFLGRTDHQVKVRGYRIELGEIEVALRRHPDVESAVVVAPETTTGERRLVGYVAVREGHSVTAEGLYEHLQGTLPAYMVPAAFVVLAALPLTPNGKVDRRALAALETQGTEATPEKLEPATATEEILAGVWAELLGHSGVGAGDDFFRLGGHSLLVMQAVARIRRIFGLELPVRALFETPVLRDLAARVDSLRAAAAPSPRPALQPVPRGRPLPLSFAQERLWFLDQLAPGGSVYNMPSAVRLEGALRPDLLARTFATIVRRHEVLRTSFQVIDGTPAQIVTSATLAELPFPEPDLSGLADATALAEARRLARDEATRPFDLATGPLFRASLVRLGEGDHVLLTTLHHAIGDEWSLRLLLREISEIYGALGEGRAPGLPELPVQYADFAAWQREWLAGDALEAQLACWRERLGGDPPVLELPTDRPRPAVQTFHGAHRRLHLHTGVSAGLRALAQREGATLFMTVLAVFQALLRRYTGQTDIAVGTPISGRDREELEPLIGFFLNTLALRVDRPDDPHFRDLLEQVRERALEAYANQDVPFERLVDELQPQRSLSHSPLFQVLFVLLHEEPPQAASLELRSANFAVEATTAKFDLTLALTARSEAFEGVLEYNTDLFDHATALRMIEHLGNLAAGVVASPEAALSQLPLLAAAERHQLVAEHNDSAADLTGGTAPVQRFFELQAARTPDRVAVACGDRQLTYAELNRAANRWAHYLRAQGVGPDVRVGISVHRSLEMVVGILAVLKAGGAYVPLDPAYPEERRAMMVEDAQAALLLTQKDLAGEWGAGAPRRIFLDEEPRGFAGVPDHDPEVAIGGDALTYVIFTSGSTGRPKGVALPHRSLYNLIEWFRHIFAGCTRTLQFASLSFDASFSESFSCWASGGTLVLVPEELRRDVPKLADFLVEQRIDSAIFPVVVLQELAEEHERREAAGGVEARALPALRQVITTGEQLQTTRAMAKLLSRLGCPFHNHYGPSESHVVTAHTLDTAPELWATHPSIGVPIPNSRVHLLDAGMSPVPFGVPGELYIGGVCLARGYLGRPDLTAERFVPDPFGEQPGERLYRTGDKVRRACDGLLDFVGRFDHQVKIRGFRVELEEIESVLGRHPGVRQTVVLAREDVPGDRRLAAYLVPESGDFNPGVWRAYLRERLPDYMVPTAFVVLEAFPLTPNGKVDRRALPMPDGLRPDLEKPYLPPGNAAEEVLAGLWADVLGLARVGVSDDFFELGGHSLLATRLIARVRSIFGLDVPLRTLFEAPTVAGMVAAAARAAGDPGLVEEIAGIYLEAQQLTEEELAELEREAGIPHE